MLKLVIGSGRFWVIFTKLVIGFGFFSTPILVHVQRMCTKNQCLIMEESSQRTKRAVIWGYYTLDSEEIKFAMCNSCGDKISRGGNCAKSYNTTNFSKPH